MVMIPASRLTFARTRVGHFGFRHLGLAAIVAITPFIHGCPTVNSDYQIEPITQVERKFSCKGQALNYLVAFPQGYASHKRWPLLLFLHGSGERGTNVWNAATHGPPQRITNGWDSPFIVVSPQCPD